MSVAESFVTKEDLSAAVAPLASKKDLAESEQRLTETLTEAIRDAQTEMLRAFYNWARPVELRLNRAEEVAQRLSWIEERIAALERGQFPSSH
jgi:hypothetical protein